MTHNREILAITALSALGLCLAIALVCAFLGKGKKKVKDGCNKVGSFLFFSALVLLAVSNLLPEDGDTYKQWPNWVAGVGQGPMTYKAANQQLASASKPCKNKCSKGTCSTSGSPCKNDSSGAGYCDIDMCPGTCKCGGGNGWCCSTECQTGTCSNVKPGTCDPDTDCQTPGDYCRPVQGGQCL